MLLQFSSFVRKNQSPPRKQCFEFLVTIAGDFTVWVFSHLVFKKTFASKRLFKVFFHFFLKNFIKQKLLPKLSFATQMLFKNRTTHCFLITENTFFITTFHQKSLFCSSAPERIKIIFIHKTHPIRFYTQMEIMENN